MRNISLFLILPLFLLASCAPQQRVTDLEKELQTQDEDFRSGYARMRSELDSLRIDLQSLQGQVEERVHTGTGVGGSAVSDEVLYLKDELFKLSERVDRLSEHVGLETTTTTTTTTAAVTGGTTVTAREDDPEKDKEKDGKAVTAPANTDADALYASAKQAFDDSNMEKAQREFEEILTKFPKSDKAGNAQFWLGEVYYRGNWYDKAILEYQKVLDNYPKGNKVASALLKQGMAFEKLDQKNNARFVLEDLVKRYPGSSEALIAQKKLQQLP